MCRVSNCFTFLKYTVLILDGDLPLCYHKLKVGGVSYKLHIAYDIPNAIAIEAVGDFVGATVESDEDDLKLYGHH